MGLYDLSLENRAPSCGKLEDKKSVQLFGNPLDSTRLCLIHLGGTPHNLCWSQVSSIFPQACSPSHPSHPLQNPWYPTPPVNQRPGVDHKVRESLPWCFRRHQQLSWAHQYILHREKPGMKVLGPRNINRLICGKVYKKRVFMCFSVKEKHADFFAT